MLDEVVVKPKREKYSRKNNPAVELMKKVIAHKNNNKLSENDYYQYNKYQKITMSLNDVTPEMLEKGMYKKMPFLKDQIELVRKPINLSFLSRWTRPLRRKFTVNIPRVRRPLSKG